MKLWDELQKEEVVGKSSVKKMFLKDFTKFTGKHLCWSLSFQKENPTQVFSCEFCEIF